MSNIKEDERNIPDMNDIYKLAMHEPIVHTIMKLHRHDNLTERDALIMMVIELAKSKKEYQELAIKYAQKYGANNVDIGFIS